MHVVVAKILAGATEITAAAAAKREACQQQHRCEYGLNSPSIRGSESVSPACQGFRSISVAGDDGEELFLVPVRGRHWFLRECVRMRMTGRIRTVPAVSRGALARLESRRREAAPAGNSMIVPISDSLWPPRRNDFGR